MFHTVVSLLSLAFLAIPSLAPAQWYPDGTPVSTAMGDQITPSIIADGTGGAFIAWGDERGADRDIYVQRIDAMGNPLWAADGVPVCLAAGIQDLPEMVSDGAGGVIITWGDSRADAGDIYAQRVNSLGAPQWAADGFPLCTVAGTQGLPQIVSDGASGAIVTWYDQRGADSDIYAQRISAVGVHSWMIDGVPLCTAAQNQTVPTIVADGAGGAIVTWRDNRADAGDIYIQSIDALGVVQWAADGFPVCTVVGLQDRPVLISDGASGAIVAWHDQRSGNHDIYAQRVTAPGVHSWMIDGVPVSLATGDQFSPSITTDGAGGAIIAWQDTRNGPFYDAFVQRISFSGNVQWTNDGVALCTEPASQGDINAVADGAGGAIVSWFDLRDGTFNVFAQHVNGGGYPQWVVDGMPVTQAAHDQDTPVIAFDGFGGAIIAFEDYRSNPNIPDIYAQRIEAVYGYWGHPEPVVTSVADIPNDQGGKVAVNWTASGRDIPVPRTVEHYTIWRGVDPVAMIASVPVLRDVSRVGKEVEGPTYATFASAPDYYFELVGTQDAHGWPGYSYSAPTRADSTSSSVSDEVFMVVAHDKDDSFIAFASNEIIGHSVDNLAPAAPLFLTAQRVGSDVELEWNNVVALDLRDYSVYRGVSPGVTPVPLNFVDSSGDSMLVDTDAPNGVLYYIVTAVDIHENQSEPSNEVNLSPVTGIDTPPSLATLTVLPNRPNPFTGSTSLRIGLPEPSDISVEVYDVAGRRVSSVYVKSAAAGWRSVSFAGRDVDGRQLSSGVYFYRVTVAGKTVTRKMVIAR